ncbi:MAG: 2-isopropylmalate synthase [Patescibacteria group bacterium]
MKKIIILDTTLRDGEQSAGAALNAQEKLDIARQLEKLGVDVIEAGFPINSGGELKAVRNIAKNVRKPIICALAHAQYSAIDAAWEAVKCAERPRIHVFLSSSDIHINHQLKKTRQQIMEISSEMVAYAKEYLDDVEFTPMDSTRTKEEYLYKILEAVIEAGATTVNIADTVGYTIPEEFCNLIEGIFKNVSNISQATVSVHCHDDLGLSVANSLSALKCGARQIECTINGIGERAGNASLEEIVMAIKTRQDLFQYFVGIDTRQISKTSKMVSELTGMPIQPNKAIVGANAFKHESGIHQDGVIKEKTTYEIMKPEDIGLAGSTLSIGKLSGRHAVRKRLEELGYTLNDADFNKAFAAFKELADKKREITDADLEALVSEELRTTSETYHLEKIHVVCGEPNTIPVAAIEIKSKDGKILPATARGTGPIDAAYKAVNKIVKIPIRLIEFNVKSITGGIDALGEVAVKIESGGRIYAGRGAHTDIVVASARAYINAINRLLSSAENK